MANSIERTGKFFYGDKIIDPRTKTSDDALLLENAVKNRDEEKLRKEATELLKEAKLTKQKELEKRLETLEMLPQGSKLIVLPYPENPYKKVITESGILIDYDGSFMNPDSGEQDKMPVGIKCAKIIEAGPDCKFAQPGDDIFYESRASAPLPFFALGYQVIVEANVFVFLNEGLKERLKK